MFSLSGDPDLLGVYLPILYALTRTQEELKVVSRIIDESIRNSVILEET